MSRIAIYYFTGTGNTRIAAKAIKSELEQSGFIVLLIDIRKDAFSLPDPNTFDMIGFGYPIHAFNAPRYFIKQIKKMPKVNNKPAFIFKTSGEPFGFNRISSWSLTHLLKRKGYQIMMERHLLMPYNIMFRYQDALAKQMYIHTHQMAKVIAYDVKINRKRHIKFNPLYLPIMYVFRVQWLGAKLNGPLFHAKKHLCTSCGVCESVCPTNNIIMKNGIPSFGGDCTMCMGCVVSCPVDAIRPGLISGMRINGHYPFKDLMGNEHISAYFISENTTGYFKLFKKYYDQTNSEIKQVEELEKEHAS